MSDDGAKCSCVIDTNGLHAIATASANLQPLLIEKLKSGEIGVPARAWQEFSALYEDEADLLKPHVGKKIPMKAAFRLGAARIADKLNSGFSRGTSDGNVELYVAAIAASYECPLITSADQAGEYGRMECVAIDFETWVKKLDA
jgi:hypothetical protein